MFVTNCATISFSRTSLPAVNFYDFTYIINVSLGINKTQSSKTANKMCVYPHTAAFDSREWTDSHCQERNRGWLQTKRPNVDYNLCIWLQLRLHEMEVHFPNLLYLHEVLHFPARSAQDVKTDRLIVFSSTCLHFFPTPICYLKMIL
jgi:hypothetical protein